MPIIASLLIAASCSWTSPGSDRFVGDPVAAIDHYSDIPAEVRAVLKRRLAKKDYDEIVTITRDKIGDGYDAAITDMHFGSNKLCRTVDRSKWAPGVIERGLVFCEKGHCLILPTVCGNLSRVTPLPKLPPLPELDAPFPNDLLPELPELFEPNKPWMTPQEPEWRDPGPIPQTVPERMPEPTPLALIGLALVVMRLCSKRDAR